MTGAPRPVRSANQTIALDEPETWPLTLHALLNDNLSLLRKHQEFERKRYATLGSGIRETELRTALNPFVEEREQLVAQVERLVFDQFVVAYHCTRLTEDEIEAVRRHGLRPLSNELQRKRVMIRVAEGSLSTGRANELISRLSPNRLDEIWAVFSREALVDEHAFRNPLRYWGGEAIFRERDGSNCDLARIGTACVVELAAPVAEVTVASIASCFIERFLYLSDGQCADEPDDLCIRVPILSEQIRRIVTRKDPEFACLTQCESWSVLIT